MESKNIIITGGSRGVGKALTIKFLEEGHNVFVIARSEDKLKEIDALEFGKQFKYAVLDLASLEDFNVLNEYIEDWKRVDVIFNNAGLLIKKPFKELTASDYMQSWKVNFLAPSMLIQAMLPKMDLKSHVVNITTMGAVQGSVKFPELSAYGSSKGALITLTEVLAQEFETTGPRLNCVALGAVQTEMLETAFPGYIAPINPEEMADYLFEFGLKGHHFMNGKIIQSSVSTP
ncbi:SDR family NAD(P)-dependent oxidoreductase [Flavobacteriaceae bacterium Ap0902]|nr:SDR family NAD(P)-dependent oxidoreductase [Flavobacteriaceae bacterium Ap0902]